MLEVERPRRGDRRRGKSDPGDAHLAALAALRVPADRCSVPRADGPREALRILLTARADLVLGRTGQINRLRALLLTGDDTDRQLARGRLPRAVLTLLTRRPGPAGEDLAARSGAASCTAWRPRSSPPPTSSPRTPTSSPRSSRHMPRS